MHESVDEWLVGHGKLVLDPEALFEAKIKQPKCLKHRNAGLRMQPQELTNFLTCVNGLGHVYSTTKQHGHNIKQKCIL